MPNTKIDAVTDDEDEDEVEVIPPVVLHRRDANVSFIAQGDMGPVRVITRPTDAVFEGHKDYAQRVVDLFAQYGITVTAKDVEAALK